MNLNSFTFMIFFPRKAIPVMDEGAFLTLKVFVKDKSDDTPIVAVIYVIYC